jgi:hypothetical protein
MPAMHIPLGELTFIPQNVVYSLPWRLCYLQSSAAIQASVDGVTWSNLNGAELAGSICGASFIRCTGAAGAQIKADGY